MSALRSLASSAAATIYDAIGVANTASELDEVARLVWRGRFDGTISEVDASLLISYIERRRPVRRVHPAARMTLPGLPLPEPNPKRVGRFPKRRAQRSRDKQASYERRHRLAASGVLPPHLAGRLTTGDMAVMRIVADEYRARTRCEMTLDEIAARAGVCRVTARRAMQKARGENLISVEERPVPGKKHLPNLVRVISLEWLKWLRAPSKSKPIGVHLRATTDNSLVDDDDDDDDGEANERAAAKSVVATPQGGQPSKEAIDFADELANIAGYRRAAVPKSWQETDPPQVVQVWLNSLAGNYPRPVQVLRGLTAGVMRRKRDSKPPFSPRYFSTEVKKLVRGRLLPSTHSGCEELKMGEVCCVRRGIREVRGMTFIFLRRSAALQVCLNCDARPDLQAPDCQLGQSTESDLQNTLWNGEISDAVLTRAS